MNEQNQYPHDSSGEPRDPSHPSPTGDTGDVGDPGEHRPPPPGGPRQPAEAPFAGFPFGDQDEHTRPIPAYQGSYPGQSGTAASPAQDGARGRRRLTAAVLVGALVLGGAAGVGGAAAYDAFLDDTPASTTGSESEGAFEATNARTVEDGTVEKVAEAVLPSVVKINVASEGGAGSGSGIVLSEDGKILTNNHVVAAGADDNGSISVSFDDGTTKEATVLGTDPLVDIAVIQVKDAADLTPASLGKSGELKVGQTVVAVGSPFGLNATVTSGIVSALNRPVSVASEEQTPQDPFGGQQQAPQARLSTTYPAIQTDAAINPGNSGGPLVDLSGRVVGINSSIRTDSAGLGSAGGSIGLGFAIPIDEVLPIVNQLSNGEEPTHARLGVSVTDVRSETLNRGAQLEAVERGAAAAEAGLEEGDVITKVDEHLIDGSDSLVAIIRGHRPGDEVEITYVRDGETRTTTADLSSDAESSDS